jgi:hypothetical protein
VERAGLGRVWLSIHAGELTYVWGSRLAVRRDHPAATTTWCDGIPLRARRPIDTIPPNWGTAIAVLKEYFFGAEWYAAYDFVEFLGNVSATGTTAFQRLCNSVLEQEMSAYRFVGGKITEITSGSEIAEIEDALQATEKGARAHLKAALDLMSDRQTPDYRNSIKESISAVEAVANAVGGTTNASLGAALKQLKQKIDIHPALEAAFSKMYGYTSDAQGIRHALMDEHKLSFEDAKFMLVSCSAFVNYLITKAGRAGIAL